MNSLSIVVYGFTLAIALTIGVLSFAGGIRSDFAFWPPPKTGGWQHQTFRVLFRLFFVGLVALSLIEIIDSRPAGWRLIVGTPLTVLGFGFALYWTGFLGWRNAFGEPEGLKTSGIYRWSRNPIYVVSIVALIGWAFLVGTWSVTSLLTLWGLFYVAAPFLEEPWLEEQYGDAFRSYKAEVPRFVGVEHA